jgi:dipeptidyl aminopeptidase/acylaminoacyl peptidase
VRREIVGRAGLTAAAVAAALAGFLADRPTADGPGPPAAVASAARQAPARDQTTESPLRSPDFDRMRRQQAETDRVWRTASAGTMQMEKIVYRSRVGDLDVPAFVFQPLTVRGPRSHPAIVWVHENIRGHLYEHYIPYVREATSRGYIVIAPEYRGSVGYDRALYDAIDYGGAEVDDVATAAAVLAEKYPGVDPARVAVMGWSHGGMIALLAAARNPGVFRAAVAKAPVTNLFHRLAERGVERQRRLIDPHNRFGGSPSDVPAVYRDRSPLFQVDRLQIPVLVHLASNDTDVSIGEGMQLVDALRARRPALSETHVYEDPPGGHLFDRRVDPNTLQPENTPEQRDSWTRVWAFLARHLS